MRLCQTVLSLCCLSIGRSDCGPKEFRGSTHSIAVEQSVSQSALHSRPQSAHRVNVCTLALQCIGVGVGALAAAAADVLAGSKI